MVANISPDAGWGDTRFSVSFINISVFGLRTEKQSKQSEILITEVTSTPVIFATQTTRT